MPEKKRFFSIDAFPYTAYTACTACTAYTAYTTYTAYPDWKYEKYKFNIENPPMLQGLFFLHFYAFSFLSDIWPRGSELWYALCFSNCIVQYYIISNITTTTIIIIIIITIAQH